MEATLLRFGSLGPVEIDGIRPRPRVLRGQQRHWRSFASAMTPLAVARNNRQQIFVESRRGTESGRENTHVHPRKSPHRYSLRPFGRLWNRPSALP